MEANIIIANELRTIVVEAINTRVTKAQLKGALRDDVRLADLGIDSLGLMLIFADLSSRTGLQFERWEGMAPIRTVDDVIQFALVLSQRSGH